MGSEGQKIIPGEEATVEQVLELAEEFRHSAIILYETGRRGKRLAWSPFRFISIHAAELFLDAYLRSRGAKADQVRSFGHNLALRRREASSRGLVLSTRTCEHLDEVSATREYVVTRYAPEMEGHRSPPNRFLATMNEVADRVMAQINKS